MDQFRPYLEGSFVALIARSREPQFMNTQDVVLLGVAINLLVAFALLVAPRVRARRQGPALSFASAEANGVGRAGLATTSPLPRGSTGGRSSIGNESPGGGRSALSTDADGAWFSSRFEAGSDVRRSAASKDPATGLDLGVAWTRWLVEEDARVRRFHRPATIVLVELAGVDRLAERLGDEAARRLIPPIAATMLAHARATDHLARLGPTRFGALLTETDEVRAINYIERVRAACDLWLEAGAVMLRLSVGWAEIGTNQPASGALEEAERRLFDERAKVGQLLDRRSIDVVAGIPDVEASPA
jgi:diguanylate cyclase (GGDEF)-like protein